jgi:hypothetical protein
LGITPQQCDTIKFNLLQKENNERTW